MKFIDEVYFSNQIPDEYYPEIRKSLEKGYTKKAYYVITLSDHADQLEICSGMITVIQSSRGISSAGTKKQAA